MENNIKEFYQITNFIELHKIFRAFRPLPTVGWWYRGQSKTEWSLIPSAGRPDYNDGSDFAHFKQWKSQAIAYSQTIPPNDWECLAVAQHYGLATRLLDWTGNPLVAVYFSVSENFDSNGAIYVHMPRGFIDKDEAEFCNIQGSPAMIPRALTKRILNQQSFFTVHFPVDSEIKPQYPNRLPKGCPDLIKIEIPKESKQEILSELDAYGINQVSLFPDLDGLSKYINWGTQQYLSRKNKSS